jgi:hypothetical protein
MHPEAADLHRLLGSLARWRDLHVPGRELWITRFGYDTHPGSPLRPPSIDDAPAELVHAQWTVRATLLLLAGGADRVIVGTWADMGTTAAAGNTSGLRGPAPGHDPKPALHQLETLHRTVGTFSVDGLLEGLPEPIWALQLAHPDGRRGVVAWLGTAQARPATDVVLPVTPASEVTVTPLDGISRTLPPSGPLRLPLSETPIVAVWDESPE